MSQLTWAAFCATLGFALMFSLSTREVHTCQQEYTAGYKQGIVETTAMFEEAAQ